MSNYTKQAIQVFLFLLIGGSIGLIFLSSVTPYDTGSAVDVMRNRIQGK